MSFLFRKKTKEESPAPSPVAPLPTSRLVAFNGYTGEGRLTGVVRVEGRLSDLLNRREEIPLMSAAWAAFPDPDTLAPTPEITWIDPYEFFLVAATAGSQPPRSDHEHAAHRVRKNLFDVQLQMPPFQVTGTIYLYPGIDPEALLLYRATEIFIPMTQAEVLLDGHLRADVGDVVLVNRTYLQGVAQLSTRQFGANI